MEHFIFLLEKLGFEVKQGKHIAVKIPGMKRFKRLDTISEDLCRESLEAMFRYGDATDEVVQVAWMNREQIKELFDANMFVDTLEYFFTEVDK